MSRVCVIDYGIGNVQSVVNACARVADAPAVARTGDELLADDPAYIVLPGVGAVGEAMQNLREKGLDEALDRRVRDAGVPFLGICVGMQLMAESCEEFGEHVCLGWLPGRVRRLAPRDAGVRLPHVGWNTVRPTSSDPLVSDVANEHMYFVHSYVVDCSSEYVVATSEYDHSFAAAVRVGNAAGVQFHPEKSSAAGERLLACFLSS